MKVFNYKKFKLAIFVALLAVIIVPVLGWAEFVATDPDKSYPDPTDPNTQIIKISRLKEDIKVNWKVWGDFKNKPTCIVSCRKPDIGGTTNCYSGGSFLYKMATSGEMVLTNLSINPDNEASNIPLSYAEDGVVIKNVKADYLFTIYCMGVDQNGLPVSTNPEPKIKIEQSINCLPLPELKKESNNTYSSNFPGVRSTNGDPKIRGTKDFMEKFYELYQKMQENGPEPDACNPLVFKDGTCYVSGDGQYGRLGDNRHSASHSGAIDIVCDNHNGAIIPIRPDNDNERCSVVNELITRVRAANQNTKFGGIRECNNLEWTKSSSSALHLHLDQEANAGGKEPVLIENADYTRGLDF